MVALILAGHGSHISPDTAGLIWSYVDKLRSWGIADEVTASFWKEAPAFNQVLATVQSSEVVIVPVFTAQGYFSRTVIPNEMNLDGSRTQQDNRTIYYTPTLGEHPDLTTIIQQRIESILQQENLDADQVAVAIIGHGTPRSQTSQNATRQQAKRLRSIAAEVVAVYLDDNPAIPSIYEITAAPNIIAIPFFLATGSHVTSDVPQALGIEINNRSTAVNGRRVYYTSPIGTHHNIIELILDLARSTGIKFEQRATTTDWCGFPQTGSEQLMADIKANGTRQFGQLMLTPTEVYPIRTKQTTTPLNSPAALRRHIREMPFRPLATATDLPRDWHVPITALQTLPPVVETVYPGALADWSQRHDFCAETLASLSERQTGLFQNIHTISHSVIDNGVETICGQCVRFPTWHSEPATMEATIPCKAPCNWWLSRVKETVG